MQYHPSVLFMQLVDTFPHLTELNGKNYTQIINKARRPSRQMKTVLTKTNKVL